MVASNKRIGLSDKPISYIQKVKLYSINVSPEIKLLYNMSQSNLSQKASKNGQFALGKG